MTVSNTQQLPPGLIAAYGFSEGTGVSTADASGRGHTGSLSGAAWTSQGQFGGALSFNGTNARVSVADAPDLDFTTGMTIEAWVHPTALSGYRTVVLKERPKGLAYALYAHDEAPRPAGYLNTGSADLSAIGSSALPLNAWSHLAMTYDGAALRLYVNGVQVGTRAVSGSILSTTGLLQIGGNSVWGEYFQGRIDEVRIYNRALAVGKIQSHLTRAISGG